MEQQDRASTSFMEMVQMAVNAKAKASLRSSIMVWDVDSRCLKGHCPSQNTSTKVQTQGSTVKVSKPKNFRLKDLKPPDEKTPAPPRINEPRKTSCHNKKKEYLKKKRDQKNSTSATEDNAIEGEKKRNNQGDKKCYNCQKKGPFCKELPESPKTSVGFGNLHTGDW